MLTVLGAASWAVDNSRARVASPWSGALADDHFVDVGVRWGGDRRLDHGCHRVRVHVLRRLEVAALEGSDDSLHVRHRAAGVDRRDAERRLLRTEDLGVLAEVGLSRRVT